MESTISILNPATVSNIEQELRSIGVSHRGTDIMKEKLIFYVIKLEKVDTRAANILKQTMLSKGAEAAGSQEGRPSRHRRHDQDRGLPQVPEGGGRGGRGSVA